MTDKKNMTSKVISAGIAGVAIGAAGVLLADKKNRKVVEKKMDQVKKWSDTTITDMKKKTDDLNLGKKAKDVKSNVETLQNSAKDMSEKTLSDISE